MEIPEKIMDIIIRVDFIELTKREMIPTLIVQIFGGQLYPPVLSEILEVPFFHGLHSHAKNSISLVFKKEMEVDGQIVKLEDYGG